MSWCPGSSLYQLPLSKHLMGNGHYLFVLRWWWPTLCKDMYIVQSHMLYTHTHICLYLHSLQGMLWLLLTITRHVTIIPYSHLNMIIDLMHTSPCWHGFEMRCSLRHFVEHYVHFIEQILCLNSFLNEWCKPQMVHNP